LGISDGSFAALPLHGKVALVTGAGKNIGRCIALTLARDGAAIVVNGRADSAAVDAVVREIEGAGGKAMAAMGDVSDPAVATRLAAAAAQQFGGVDILVSNAGLRRQTSFLDMSFDEWREILSVALDGAFLLAKAVVPQMVARGGQKFDFMIMRRTYAESVFGVKLTPGLGGCAHRGSCTIRFCQ